VEVPREWGEKEGEGGGKGGGGKGGEKGRGQQSHTLRRHFRAFSPQVNPTIDSTVPAATWKRRCNPYAPCSFHTGICCPVFTCLQFMLLAPGYWPVFELQICGGSHREKNVNAEHIA